MFTPIQSESYLQTMALANHRTARDPHRTYQEQMKELRALADSTYLAGMKFGRERGELFGLRAGLLVGFVGGLLLWAAVAAL